MVLTFEAVGEFLSYDHSNEISSAVLLHRFIYYSAFYKMEIEIFV